MKPLPLIIFVIGLLLTTQACKDDDAVDACAGTAPVSAAFTTSYEMGWLDSTRRFQADTFVNYFPVIFTAEQENASYKWTVGTDPRVFDEKEFTLTFVGIEGPLEIRLIVEATPDLDCFPDDDGRDTIYHEIYFVKKTDSPMLGKYRGVVLSEPSDTFDIEIQTIPPYYEDNNIDNFPKGCIRTDDNYLSFLLGYRHLKMGYLGNYNYCPRPQGWAYLDWSSILTIEYTIWNPSIQKLQSDFFVGQKIN